jgi:hypothetical protein
MGIMTDQPQQQDATQGEDVSAAWKVFRTLCFVAWMAASAFFGLEVLEFGAGVDGIGYAHTSVPTLVTAAVGLVCMVLIGMLAVPVYRGRLGYIAGAGLGLGFWLVSFVLGAWSLDLHYERVCDTMLAPRACNFVTGLGDERCVPEVDARCAERLERACVLGSGRACKRAVRNGLLPQTQACNALADKCDEARRCDSDNPPPACGGPRVPRFEKLMEDRVCGAFEAQCRQSEE